MHPHPISTATDTRPQTGYIAPTMETESEATRPSQPTPKPFSFPRVLRRLILLALSIFGVIWTLESTLLPWLVSREVAHALASLGLADPSFAIRNVSFSRAVVAQIGGANPQDPAVDAAVIQYDFPSILRGRLNQIDLTGAKLTYDLDHSTIGLSFSNEPSSSTSLQSLPVEKIVLRSSTLILHSTQGDYWLSTSGTLDNQGGLFNVHLDGFTSSASLVLDGIVDPSGNATDLHLQVSNLALASIPFAKSIAGSADIQAHYHQLNGQPLLEATFSSKQIALQTTRLVLHDVNVNLNSSITGGNDVVANILPTSTATVGSAETADWTISSNDPAKPVALIQFSNGQLSGIQAQAAASVLLQNDAVIRREGTTRIPTVSGNLSVQFAADAAGINLSASPSASLTAPDVIVGDATTHVPAVHVSGTVRVNDSQSPLVDLLLQFENASIESNKVWARGISGTVPVRWNVTGKRGSLQSQNVGIAQCTFAGATTNISVNDSHLLMDAQWHPLKESNLSATGSFDLTQLPARGELDVQLPQFPLNDSAEMATVFPQLGGAAVLGTFSGEGKITLAGGRLTPNLNLHAHDLQIANKDYDLKIDGAGGVFTLDSFSPVTSPGQQHVFITHAHLGKMDLTNGNIDYRLESAQSIFFEKSDWESEGGKLYTSDFRIDNSPTSLQLIVEGNNLSLKSILATFFPGQATGDGTVYGRMPVKIRWPQLTFGTGFLYSTPGGGTFQLGSDMLTSLGDMLNSNDPRFASDPTFMQIKARTLEAMTHFQYDILKIDWKPGPDGLLGTVAFHGKGEGDAGQPLNMTVNFSNLDKALTRYIIMRKETNQPQ